jgi:hypothetical protein
MGFVCLDAAGIDRGFEGSSPIFDQDMSNIPTT